MPPKPQSLYEVLRIPRDAAPRDIDRAYRRIITELQRETTPPDPRLRVMIEHAHDVLMDPVRRENYDNEYFAPKARLDRARRSRATMAVVAAIVAVAAVGAWLAMRPEEPARPAKPIAQVQSEAAMAVGRVARIELDGSATPLGAAFAIAEGTLVTSCEGITPTAELVVQFGKRAGPVRATGIEDRTQLCKLGGGTVGSWPLPLSQAAAQPGQAVYMVSLAGSAPQLKKAVFGQTPPRPEDLGTPLLDDEGRVLGALSRVDGALRYVAVPAAWAVIEPPVYSAPQPKAKPTPSPAEPNPSGPDISPERREKLEKAFRGPPPQVPNDL